VGLWDANPGALAGSTCLGCHAITAIDSPRWNGDCAIADPPCYPLAFTENELLQAVNPQRMKAKPGFHKATRPEPLRQLPS